MMFALIDCNNFYASCEQLFDPSLRHRPLIILSNNDGCIIARSKEAKTMGIKMGDPFFQYRKQIEQKIISVRSSNFALYGDLSQRVMQTLETFPFPLEIYSIDEAFLFLKNLPEKELYQLGEMIKQRIEQWTGIPVSIGIGRTKTLAKIANDLAKKIDSGIVILLDPQEIETRLQNVSIEEIWGIGTRLASRLKSYRITTAAQLRTTEDCFLKNLLGIMGLRTAYELRGTVCFDCQTQPQSPQSICCSRSFSQAIQDHNLLKEAISTFVALAARRLRKQKMETEFLSVFITTSPFQENTVYENCCHFPLTTPTAYTPHLLTAAHVALSKIYRNGLLFKRAGVVLQHLSSLKRAQLNLFESSFEKEKKRNLMETVDRLNRGKKKTIIFAAEGLKQEWKSKQTNPSRSYTTKWEELLIVRAS